jgi:flavin reductase (DIM6/NTAB) family NADH-FMN oxidoreductase RutF
MARRVVDKEIAHRLLAGGPVVLVATRYGERANVMAASWITPISMSPPLLAVSVHKGSLTHEYIERSGEFTVNVPGRALLHRVRDSGMISGNDVAEKLRQVGLEPLAAESLDTPILRGCLGYLECSVQEAYDAGEDHTLFVAEVVAAQAEDEAFDETWLLPEEEEAKPLHHLGGNTYAVLDKLILAAPQPDEGRE